MDVVIEESQCSKWQQNFVISAARARLDDVLENHEIAREQMSVVSGKFFTVDLASRGKKNLRVILATIAV